MTVMPQQITTFQDKTLNYIPSENTVSSLPIVPRRTRVDQPTSAWFQKLEDRFSELTSLPRGWDGYTGKPVSFPCAYFAANLIERLYVKGVREPALVPGSDGTLQIEWHYNRYDIEADVLAPYKVVAYRLDHMTGREEEMEIQADFTKLADWVIALGQSRTSA